MTDMTHNEKVATLCLFLLCLLIVLLWVYEGCATAGKVVW